MRTSIICLAIVASIAGTSCISTQDTAQAQGAPPPKVAAMTLQSHLVRRPGNDGPAEVVLATLALTDSSGDVVATPRILTFVGEPASLRIGTKSDWIDVSVQARRERGTVIVDAELISSDGITHLTATNEAKDKPMPVARAR